MVKLISAVSVVPLRTTASVLSGFTVTLPYCGPLMTLTLAMSPSGSSSVVTRPETAEALKLASRVTPAGVGVGSGPPLRAARALRG